MRIEVHSHMQQTKQYISNKKEHIYIYIYMHYSKKYSSVRTGSELVSLPSMRVQLLDDEISSR